MTVEAQYFQLIDFNQVEVVSLMIYPPRPALVVGGVAPFVGAEVSLVPLVYIGRPPFVGIQVVCKPGDGGAPETDGGSAVYSVQIDLAGVTGTQGVEVIGATRTAQIVLNQEGA
jgi:hypothetical protein